MKNYEATKNAYIKSLSPELKKTFAYTAGPARDRCAEKGLFQGRTEDVKTIVIKTREAA